MRHVHLSRCLIKLSNLFSIFLESISATATSVETRAYNLERNLEVEDISTKRRTVRRYRLHDCGAAAPARRGTRSSLVHFSLELSWQIAAPTRGANKVEAASSFQHEQYLLDSSGTRLWHSPLLGFYVLLVQG